MNPGHGGLPEIADWIGIACIAGSLCGAVYALIATWAMRSVTARKTLDGRNFPSVALLKPLRGDEPGLYANLESFCRQDYPGPVQIVFGVQDPDDPVIAVVRGLQQAYPDTDIALTIGASGAGGNRKIANLINMAPLADGEIFVISDSDVRVESDHLRQVVAALQQPQAGLATCLYRGQATGSIWSALAAMDVDYRFMPSVATGLKLRLADPCLGPTMALRRTLLEEIGGFEYLSDFLADDYELGRAVENRGYKVVFARGLIDHLCPERSLREMLVHEFRWARTVRLVEPAGYFGTGITHFLTLALIGSILLRFSGWSVLALAGIVMLRFVLAERLCRYMGASRQGLYLLPLRDLLSFGVYVAAFFSDRVEWRGNRLKLSRSGEVIALHAKGDNTADNAGFAAGRLSAGSLVHPMARNLVGDEERL